jgi:hypothetical protein
VKLTGVLPIPTSPRLLTQLALSQIVAPLGTSLGKTSVALARELGPS